MQDWIGTAGFDRPEDHWPRQWMAAYIDFAAGEKRAWLHAQGVRFFPVVGWAERGGSVATGHGNSVPRFHLTWRTGPGVLAPFIRRVNAGVASGLIELRFRHRVLALHITSGGVDGVEGEILEASNIARGEANSRAVVGDFSLRASAVIVTSGGIGGNQELVRTYWPARLGEPPRHMLSGVPEHVDGRMLGVTEAAGARVINRDRMWHYTEGIRNWNPVWARHGIRILYSWFVLTQKIIEKEFALSGSEQNPDLTGKSVRQTLARVMPGATPPVEAFKTHGADFVVARSLDDLVRGMNAITDAPRIDLESLRRVIEARDAQLDNTFCKDAQIVALRGARNYLGDRLVRVARPHRILDPKAGPLIAVRLSILTRKTLGGVETDLSGRALGESGTPIPGLYAAGEVAGFGGGGMHGYRALEGTFLGGCIFSGRVAGRAAATAVR